MSELRFDSRVVIVTGAGRGLGAAYARLLGGRGAHVIVNDLGCDVTGNGSDREPATDVARRVREAGGSAQVSFHDVREPEAARALVDATLAEFGRVDAVVHNAGINTQTDFASTTPEEMRRHLAVDPMASYHVTRSVWPLFVGQGYGRLVFSTSGGMLGLPKVTAYGAAKGATWMFARCLAAASPDGIKVNAVAPAAFSRMTAGNPVLSGQELNARRRHQPAEAVAPLVAALLHESCPAHGELFGAGGGLVTRLYVAETRGYYQEHLTPEDILEHWEEVISTEDNSGPLGLAEQPRMFWSKVPPWAARA